MIHSRRSWLRGLTGSISCSPALLLNSCKEGGRGKIENELIHARSEAFHTEIALSVPAQFEHLIEPAFQEAERIANIFSLWTDSPLSRLNESGTLTNPPNELLDCLYLARQLWERSNGIFDPTVQPLWDLYEGYFAQNPFAVEGPSEDKINEARTLVDFSKVEISDQKIGFQRKGMALTLNALAQGYAADQVAAFLQRKHCFAALIYTGEHFGLGTMPSGEPWTIDLLDANRNTQGHFSLNNQGCATSSGSGTVFDEAERFHHIFHPHKSEFSLSKRSVSVRATSAALADGLATIASLCDSATFQKIASRFEGVDWKVFFAANAGAR